MRHCFARIVGNVFPLKRLQAGSPEKGKKLVAQVQIAAKGDKNLIGAGRSRRKCIRLTNAFQPTVEPGLSPLFWGCAGGALMIIMYRKFKRKQEEKAD